MSSSLLREVPLERAAAPTDTLGSPLVLIVDDDASLRRALSVCLASIPAGIVEAATAREAVGATVARRPDLITLDVGLPDAGGAALCAELRRATWAPILVVSGRAAQSEKVALLNAGADDFVTKPFDVAELVARVRSQLRRSKERQSAAMVIERDGLRVDLAKRRASRAGVAICLTPTEWSILETLAQHGGRSLTHRQIFDAVWNRSFGNPQQYLRVFVTHLRRKIEREPANPRIIITEPNVGYRFG